jgi:hypothetical protein
MSLPYFMGNHPLVKPVFSATDPRLIRTFDKRIGTPGMGATGNITLIGSICDTRCKEYLHYVASSSIPLKTLGILAFVQDIQILPKKQDVICLFNGFRSCTDNIIIMVYSHLCLIGR